MSFLMHFKAPFVSYIVNMMAHDYLGVQGARVLAANILTKFAQYNPEPAR